MFLMKWLNNLGVQVLTNFASPLCYTGNKTRLLPLIDHVIQESKLEYHTFFDLFGGSGVVGLAQDCETVFYNDADKYISQLLSVIQESKLDNIIKRVEFLIDKYNLTKDDKQAYLQFRECFNSLGYKLLDDNMYKIRFSANMCLLVLCFFSFNHYITFNKNGKFTTPAGTHRSSYNKSIKNKLINYKNRMDTKNLTITNGDFERVVDTRILATQGDLSNDLYFIDSPYILSDSQYTRTYGNKWDIADEERLYTVCDKINELGGKFIVTNLAESKGQKNSLLLTFAKKYVTIDTNVDFGNCNYQRGNKRTDKEILVKNF